MDELNRRMIHGVGWLAPEAGLTLLILAVIVADLVFRRSRTFVGWIALLGTLVLLALTVRAWSVFPENVIFGGGEHREPLFFGMAALDRYALFFKALFLATTAVVILMAMPVVAKWESGRGEVWTLVLSCTLGTCLMASASNLLMMYLSLEFASVTSYVLAGFLRRNRRSAEASLKYILYGAAASGLMIYGMSFLYGLTGTLDVRDVGLKLRELGSEVPQTMLLVISTLIMGGFGYKIAAAPFHMWCPDVYEGAPTPVTAYFSVVPKAAGFAMLIRFLQGAMPLPEGGAAGFDWRVVIAFLAVLTLTIGNFGALLQQNLKRLMAYSSIGHAGIMLLALVVLAPSNVASVMFYLGVYMLMNLGAFLVVIVLEEQLGVTTVDQCRGLGWRMPALSAAMVILLLSLTGLPPTAGFVGKLMVFGYLIDHALAGSPTASFEVALVVVGVLFSIVSLFYYARIIAAMFLRKPEESAGWTPVASGTGGLIWLLAGATLFFGLMPGWLMEVVKDSAGAAGR